MLSKSLTQKRVDAKQEDSSIAINPKQSRFKKFQDLQKLDFKSALKDVKEETTEMKEDQQGSTKKKRHKPVDEKFEKKFRNLSIEEQAWEGEIVVRSGIGRQKLDNDGNSAQIEKKVL